MLLEALMLRYHQKMVGAGALGWAVNDTVFGADKESRLPSLFQLTVLLRVLLIQLRMPT
jgi:hypothetical protein